MDQKPQEKNIKSVESLIDTNRVFNFSDGVFAFAATLLVLKIDLPNLSPNEINSARLSVELFNLWPSYFANIISFLIIAYYWLTHHAIFSLIKKLDPIIVWLNVTFLIFLSFIPFPVDLFGDYSNSDVIVAFYCFSIALVGLILGIIWLYALHKPGLVDSNLTQRQTLYYSCRFLLAPLVFAVSIPLTFIDPLIAKISWFFVIIGIILINRIFHLKRLSALEKELT